MAKGVNKVILVGHLGADPDVRYTANGTAVVRFNIATTESYPSGEGNWEERTEWHRVVVFGKQAEACGNYLSKGRLVYVEGRLQTRQWEDPQGVKKYTTEVVARDVVFLGGAGDQPPRAQGYQSGTQGGGRQQPGRPTSEELPPMPGGPEEDIPF